MLLVCYYIIIMFSLFLAFVVGTIAYLVIDSIIFNIMCGGSWGCWPLKEFDIHFFSVTIAIIIAVIVIAFLRIHKAKLIIKKRKL
jgi:hypothetical protein